MNRENYNNQAMTDYLLGALPEAEAENFDELSFTDDDFADQLSVAEKDLVDAYVRGELLNERLEQFETYYLASPIRREKVEFARSFQVFAEKKLSKSQDEKVIIAETKTDESAGGFFSFFEIFKKRNFAMQFGFAAILLLILGLGGWLLINNLTRQDGGEIVEKTPTPTKEPTPEIKPTATTEPKQEIVSGNNEDKIPLPPTPELKPTQTPIQQKTPIAKPTKTPKQQLPQKTPQRVRLASFILTPPLRGSNQIKQISLPQNTENVAMQLELELDEFVAYKVALVDQSGKNLWQSGTIKSSKKKESGVLNVRFPAKLLNNKIYNLKVSGIGEDGSAEAISSYPFRVVLK